MPARRLMWKFFPLYCLLTAGALTAVGLWAGQSLSRFYHEHLREELVARAELVRGQFEALPQFTDTPEIHQLASDLARRGAFRVTIIDREGKVLADSDENPAVENNHLDRPEVEQALAEGVGYSYRFSHTLGTEMMYAAVPLKRGDGIAAVLRVALPNTRITSALRNLYLSLTLACVAVAAISVFFGWLFTRGLIRPLEQIRLGAERFAQGDFSQRLPLSASREIAGVTEGLNQMARLLDERIETIVRQRNEQEAVLASMVESVVAVDNLGRIISLNQAAATLFGLNPDRLYGQPLQAVVRNSALQRLIADALQSALPIERELTLHTPEEQILQAHGAALRDADGRHIGAVVVMNDITRLRRLEQVRRDFVANVSHELKTPITAIKGFVETLLDGPLRDPEDARRFLEIVVKQADRLSAIIEDLLTLSRLEQEGGCVAGRLEAAPLGPVVDNAVQTCAPAAAARDVQIEAKVDPTVAVRVNAQLLEQGLVNLIDNAVKYSDPQGRVSIWAESLPGAVAVHVKDQGCGIASDHLPRIFERFYRVEKGRSRRAGGTGLGLSIVKHIAHSHGGSVQVKSKVGEGSTFTITLPAP